jgi:hypothetical protein
VITATPSNAFSVTPERRPQKAGGCRPKHSISAHLPSSRDTLLSARRGDAAASSKECQGCQLVEPWCRGGTAKGITATVFVDGTDSTARLQHTFVAGESLSLITKTIRERQESRAGVLHEKTMWDSSTRSRVDNPRFTAKYAGFCNKDGDVVTDAVEFVAFVQTNVLEPLADCFESVTYFLKRQAGKVPSNYTSYDDFKKELDSFEFTLAEPSVLARLAYIEQFMHKQQQAGVFKEV